MNVSKCQIRKFLWQTSKKELKGLGGGIFLSAEWSPVIASLLPCGYCAFITQLLNIVFSCFPSSSVLEMVTEIA